MTPESRSFMIIPAGSGIDTGGSEAEAQYLRDQIVRHIKDVVAEEREACAKLADQYKQEQGMLLHIGGESAKTI